MKIFVTGFNGFVAKHLLAALSVQTAVEIVTDLKFIGEKYDTIIHLAAVTDTSPDFNPKLIESNFIFAEKILTRTDCRIIYASSCSARYNTSPYALSKIYNEHLGRKHPNSVGLRFFNLYGPGNNKGIVKYIIDQPEDAQILLRGPELIRDYVFVEDAVDYIMTELFLPTPYGSYVFEVGTGIGTSTLQLVNLFSKLSGKVFNIETVDARDDEPKSMVAIKSFFEPVTPLRIGLAKTIHDAEEKGKI